MKDPYVLDRREFTREAVLAVLGGSTITILGCGSGYNNPAGPSQPANVVGAISVNHGHDAVVTGAQIVAGNSVSLSIRGTATHDHAVELSQADITQLKNGGAVSRASSTGDTDRHAHTVAFQGPPPGSGGYGG